MKPPKTDQVIDYKNVLAAAVVISLTLIACGYGVTEMPGRTVADLPTSELLIDSQHVRVRISATPRDRALGFQYATRAQIRQELIYFRYRHAQRPRFHMINVVAPLLIAWIGPDHQVIGVERMVPGTCCYEPPGEIIAALELSPQNPLAARIHPGTRILWPARFSSAIHKRVHNAPP